MGDGALRDQTGQPISAVLADIDGTMVTKDKVLTERAIQAVNRLRERGIVFTICSGRSPRGLRMLVEPLRLTMPMAAFNGGVIVLPDLSVLDERAIPDYVVPAIVEAIEAHGLDVWIYTATDWYVRSRQAPRVDREASTSQCEPTVVAAFDGVARAASSRLSASAMTTTESPRVKRRFRTAFGTQVSAARSQPYYLDVTHPTANKGSVIERLARYLKIPMEAIATIGDQPTDVLMFRPSGLSIAMGNANEDVQRQATHVTTSHEDEGFANAVDRFILPRAAAGRDRRAEGHRTAPSARPEPVARQHHPRSADERNAQALHRRPVGDRTHLEPDDLRAGDQEQLRVRHRDLRQARAGQVGRSAVLRARARGPQTRRRSVSTHLRSDQRHGRVGVARGFAAARLRHRRDHRRSQDSLRRTGRSSEPDDQDPRDRGRTARHRGGHLRRHPDQRHAAVLARALFRGRRGVLARHRTADRRRAEAGRGLGGVGIRQPLGRRGRRRRARRAARSARDRHRQAHLQGVPIAPQLAAVAARLQRRRPAAAAAVGQHGYQGSQGV